MKKLLAIGASTDSAMAGLEALAGLLFDAVVNADPAEFEAIGDAVARFKTETRHSNRR